MTFEHFAPFLIPTIHFRYFFVSFAFIALASIVGIIIHHPFALLFCAVLYYFNMNISKNPNNNRLLNNNKNVVNNNNAGAPPQPQNEAIVDKLHGALNALRRERDENHRRKDLAMERCRLMTEEKEHMAKNAAAMKERLETIQESLATTKRDLAPREASVQKLSKQVRGMR